MWLWKKFWNTDIIGKIYILIILFIIVVATITVITRNEKARVKETNNNIIQNEINISESNKIAMLNQEYNNKEIEETNSKKEIEEEQTSLNIGNNSNSSNNKNVSNKTETISKTEIKEKKETKEQEKTEISVKEEPVKEEIQEQSKEEVNQETKEETTEGTTVNVQVKEEYKVNTNMINTMKNFIQNNPSDDMINYGYEVVVDSSIVELTNQFTYTEQRMRNFLTHRFGTIKIYAMDYYYNGNLVMTECFIL